MECARLVALAVAIVAALGTVLAGPRPGGAPAPADPFAAGNRAW